MWSRWKLSLDFSLLPGFLTAFGGFRGFPDSFTAEIPTGVEKTARRNKVWGLLTELDRCQVTWGETDSYSPKTTRYCFLWMNEKGSLNQRFWTTVLKAISGSMTHLVGLWPGVWSLNIQPLDYSVKQQRTKHCCCSVRESDWSWGFIFTDGG